MHPGAMEFQQKMVANEGPMPPRVTRLRSMASQLFWQQASIKERRYGRAEGAA